MVYRETLLSPEAIKRGLGCSVSPAVTRLNTHSSSPNFIGHCSVLTSEDNALQGATQMKQTTVCK